MLDVQTVNHLGMPVRSRKKNHSTKNSEREEEGNYWVGCCMCIDIKKYVYEKVLHGTAVKSCK
jgi:hypothetical protein